MVFVALCGAVKAQTKPQMKPRSSTEKLDYRGCWSGADRALTVMLIKGNTVQDSRSRKIFHFKEISRDTKTKKVMLYLKDEIPSRRHFEIEFVSDDEILVGMPMFRDQCKALPVTGSERKAIRTLPIKTGPHFDRPRQTEQSSAYRETQPQNKESKA
jgi:hypothetical protein